MNDRCGSHPAIEALSSFDRFLGLTHVFARDRDSRIVYWGTSAQKLYGWSAPEAIGRKSNELLRTQFSIPLDRIERMVEEEGSWEGNLSQATRSGELKRVASYWARYHQASDPDYCIFEDNNDITRVFEMSRRLDETVKRAREEIATRDTFVATVAHELRTPLNAVLLAAQAARLTLVSNREATHPNLERIVERIETTADAERLDESVRNLLSNAIKIHAAGRTYRADDGAKRPWGRADSVG
jgi:PAS domain S-box-containing protein